ncbi:hypothetical protein [Microbacterium sp. SSM24]|uniref:hypothetical protein n=1 Tax=Microbacterium sp. SSM24 TaxID=2991714 RepID=UPI002225CAB6|nr:hypothetical protein [Microbacterium sp. SSM24]MCW3493980.1 hypothetical protein [Microbacterium sp. SSM24]
MLHDRRRIAVRSLGTIGLLAVAAALIVGCRPEAGPGSTGDPTPSISTRPTGASPTPIETELPGAGFEVPASCEDVYSAAMLSSLTADNPPLNDPDVTMLSTQDIDLNQIIDGGAATLRCSWGLPGEYGLATNVTAIDAEQGEFILAELAASGAACEPLGSGTVCRFEQKGVTQDDQVYTSGETHYVGDGGWVSTSWLNFAPEGYTEDIVDTVWG